MKPISTLAGARGCIGDCRQGRHACPRADACSGLRLDLHRVELANGQTLQHAVDVEWHAAFRRRARTLCFGLAVVAALAALSCGSRAFAADGETAATIAAAADTGSTVAVVASGVGVEANALMANPAAFAVLSVAKIAAPRMTRDMEPHQRRVVLRSMTALWGGAAANNLAVIAGAGCPPCIGLVVGAWLWLREDERDPAPVSAPEADARLAQADTTSAPPIR